MAITKDLRRAEVCGCRLLPFIVVYQVHACHKRTHVRNVVFVDWSLPWSIGLTYLVIEL